MCYPDGPLSRKGLARVNDDAQNKIVSLGKHKTNIDETHYISTTGILFDKTCTF